MTGKRRGRARFSGRDLGARVASAKGRRGSSGAWLARQLNDPYVAEAQRRGFRSRAAFKLIEIDDKCRLLRPGMRVVDLGAAPGGWSQLAAQRIGAAEGAGRIVAIDTAPMDPIAGVTILAGDATGPDATLTIRAALGGAAGLVLCDMAAPATGHGATDHLRAMALAAAAHEIAGRILAPGGALVLKVLKGGEEDAFMSALRGDFAVVRYVKPPSSRADSREIYIVATGFRAAAGAGEASA